MQEVAIMAIGAIIAGLSRFRALRPLAWRWNVMLSAGFLILCTPGRGDESPSRPGVTASTGVPGVQPRHPLRHRRRARPARRKLNRCVPPRSSGSRRFHR